MTFVPLLHFCPYDDWSIQSKRRQVIFQAQQPSTSFMQEPTEKPLNSTVLFGVHYIHFLFPISQLRYSRSPSPVADLGYESQYTSRSSLPTRPKGLTTMTSMIISNLSDTVSKNDVSVSSVFHPKISLCSRFFDYVTCDL